METNWTYRKIQRYVECQRKRATRGGCNRCKKLVPILELAGSPPLSRMVRDGYGIKRIKEAIESRGWFCRGCARGHVRKEQETKIRGWKKKQQQLQCPELALFNKRDWGDERKFAYCLDDNLGFGSREDKARELWGGRELEVVLENLREYS